MLAEAGATGRPDRGAEFHTRTMADAALDVHRIAGGEARTIVPPVASCDLSVRIAPGQTRRRSPGRSRRWCAPPSPSAPSSKLSTTLASPSLFDPGARRCRIARGALARVCGREPVLLRSGGTLPILASFADRGIPAIVSGFGLPEDNFHAPDESFTLAGLELGRRAARALYEDLGAGLARGA